MVIQYSTGDALNQALGNVGSVLGSVLGQQGYQSQQKKYGTILNEELSKLGTEFTPQNYQNALLGAVKRGVPLSIADKFASTYSQLKKAEPKSIFEGKSSDEVSSIFQSFGMDKETADKNANLYNSLTTGGKTKFGEAIIDKLLRGDLKGFNSAPGLQSQSPEEEVVKENITENLEPSSDRANVEAQEEVFSFPQINPFEGLTPKEAVSHQAKLYKDNQSHYSEITDKIKNEKRELRDVDQLQRINDSGKLPDKLSRFININTKTGDLRIPALASPQVQLFIKTVNGFIRKAKESFGSRVTNFDLQAFLKTLPTLANSEEGRRLILAQMKAATELDQLDNDALRETYEHYGLRKIDREQAEKIARQLKSRKEKDLENAFANSINAHQDFDFKKRTPEGRIPVISSTGEKGYILENQLEEALKRGFKRI